MELGRLPAFTRPAVARTSRAHTGVRRAPADPGWSTVGWGVRETSVVSPPSRLSHSGSCSTITSATRHRQPPSTSSAGRHTQTRPATSAIASAARGYRRRYVRVELPRSGEKPSAVPTGFRTTRRRRGIGPSCTDRPPTCRLVIALSPCPSLGSLLRASAGAVRLSHGSLGTAARDPHLAEGRYGSRRKKRRRRSSPPLPAPYVHALVPGKYRATRDDLLDAAG